MILSSSIITGIKDSLRENASLLNMFNIRFSVYILVYLNNVDIFFVCFSLSLFVNFLVPMDSLSLFNLCPLLFAQSRDHLKNREGPPVASP